MENSLVSVVIPVYNVEKYLRQCLDSVLNQTYTNYEVIMVDDGSTDLSGMICDEYAEKDSRFRVIHKENGGLSVARNIGYDASHGEYVYYIDSDDWIESKTLEQLVQKASDTNADFVFFDGKSFEDSDKGYNVKQGYIRKRQYDIGSGIAVFDELQKSKDFKSAIPTYLWKKSFLEKNKMSFYPGILYEDMIYSFEVYCKAKTVAHCYKPFYQRRLRAGSIVMSKPSKRNFQSACIVFDEVVRIARETGYQSRSSVISYIARVGMRPIDIYSQLSATDRQECQTEYKQIKDTIKKAKGYGDKALYFRAHGKLPWVIYKAIQKIARS